MRSLQARAVAREREQIFGLAPESPARRGPGHAYRAVVALLLGLFALILLPGSALAGGQTLLVGTQTGLSLERAIGVSNADSGAADTIMFDSSARNDTVTHALPAVQRTVTIDGGPGTPVGLDFTGLSGDGLTVNADSVTLNGLAIFGAGGDGVNVTGGGADTFTHLYLGLKPDGTPAGNATGMRLGGAGGNTVGGASDAVGVYIAGNTGPGLALSSPGNVVQNSFLGFEPAGARALNGGPAIQADTVTLRSELLGNDIAAGASAIDWGDARNVASGNSFDVAAGGTPIQVVGGGAGTPANPPAITGGTVTPNATTMDGSVDVAPNSDVQLLFYDVSSTGGRTFFSPFFTGGLHTDAAGRGDFQLTAPKALAPGHALVAFEQSSSGGALFESQASAPFDPSAAPTCSPAPAAQALTFHFAGGLDADGRYVDALYQALLGRHASAGELGSLGGALRGGALTRMQLAQVVLASPEFLAREVPALYGAFLDRPPSPAETSFGVTFLGATGLREFETTLLSSDELVACSGGTNTTLIGLLFRDLLGRAADPSSLAFYGGLLESGTPRSQVVADILGSAEGRRALLGNLFQTFLGRQPTPGEAGGLIGLLLSNPIETVEADVLASSEFLGHVGEPPAWRSFRFAPSGIIVVNLARPAYLQLSVFRVTFTGGVRARSRRRLVRVGVVRFGRHRRGRARLRWNHRVKRRRLRRGSYVVLLQATDRRGRLQFQSNPVRLTLRR